jgi:Co/Zn/Cd efflux system component
MMVAEIVGGLPFGSIALVADGLHMSTHASALLPAALAYRYARRYAEDVRFSFGTGKLGDLAGFSSAIILESRDEIPEPHEFVACISINHCGTYSVDFQEHDHARGKAHRDNNMRAAIIHVLADAAVSVLVIVGLLFGRFLGWTWMDPVAGLCGAVVIAAWSYGLIQDTGAVLLDMNPDRAMAERMRTLIETDGDQLTDFHVWRLGPGHLGAVLSVVTNRQRGPEYYQSLLSRFRSLSHVTIEVQRP